VLFVALKWLEIRNIDCETNPLVNMKRIIKTLFAVLSLTIACVTSAQSQTARQDHNELRIAIEQFLTAQAAGLPGQISVVVGTIDPRLNVAACTAPEPFLPSGSRAWGKTSVGVRCAAPTAWIIYLKATVKVQGDYVSAAIPLAQGKVIEASDLKTVQGDLAALPSGVITNASQAIGQKLSMSVPLGAPLRKELLRSQPAIQPGQAVRLVSSGPGFKVSSEGRAIGSANDGQLVQTRTASGQTVSGIARMGGIVEVTY
jgi:flagellar basal body P-ring formation protein FlgA